MFLWRKTSLKVPEGHKQSSRVCSLSVCHKQSSRDAVKVDLGFLLQDFRIRQQPNRIAARLASQFLSSIDIKACLTPKHPCKEVNSTDLNFHRITVWLSYKIFLNFLSQKESYCALKNTTNTFIAAKASVGDNLLH